MKRMISIVSLFVFLFGWASFAYALPTLDEVNSTKKEWHFYVPNNSGMIKNCITRWNNDTKTWETVICLKDLKENKDATTP
jgi:hypothetical protein